MKTIEINYSVRSESPAKKTHSFPHACADVSVNADVCPLLWKFASATNASESVRAIRLESDIKGSGGNNGAAAELIKFIEWPDNKIHYGEHAEQPPLTRT
jgi:hypothetical protein